MVRSAQLYRNAVDQELVPRISICRKPKRRETDFISAARPRISHSACKAGDAPPPNEWGSRHETPRAAPAGTRAPSLISSDRFPERLNAPCGIFQEESPEARRRSRGRIRFRPKVQSQSGIFVGEVKYRLHMKTPHMGFRQAEKPDLAENSRQREVGVVAHVVQVRRQSLLAHQYGQQIVSSRYAPRR